MQLNYLLLILPPLSTLCYDWRENPKKIDSLSDCILSTAQQFFSNHQSILYSTSMQELALNARSLPRLARDGRWTILVRNPSTVKNLQELNPPPPPVYLIQTPELQLFGSYINTLSNLPNWNPHAKFLIYSSAVFQQPQNVAGEIIQELGKVDVLNAVVLVAANSTTFQAYSWFPFKNGKCGRDAPHLSLIGSCTFGSITRRNLWFRNKVPQRFNGCLIKVRMVELLPFVINVRNSSLGLRNDYFTHRGLDVNMVDTVAQVFNLTMLYRTAKTPLNWGNVYPNGSAAGNLQYLRDGVDDMVIGGYMTTAERCQFFDCSVNYYQDTVHWCVPRILTDRRFESFTSIIDTNALVLTLVIYFILTVILWYLDRNSSLINQLLNTIAILLGYPVPSMADGFKTRLIILMLIVNSLCLITAYRTYLISNLTNSGNEEVIKTLEDIVRNNFTTYSLPNFGKFFQDNSNPASSRINRLVLERWRSCPDMDECIKFLTRDKDRAVFLPISSTLVTTTSTQVKCLPKIEVSHWLNVLMRKGFPLYERISGLIARLIEAGFIEKWRKDLSRIRISTGIVTDDEEALKVLNFHSLHPVFVVLSVGLALATSAFVMELIMAKLVTTF